MTARTLHAFWSYTRDTEDSGGQQLHAALAGALRNVLPPFDVEVFRDTDARTGLPSGSHWGDATVRAVARSLWFFWVQSPRWAYRPICRFELEMFRDRLRRLAYHLRARGEHVFQLLWENLVVPVRWQEIESWQWDEVPAPVRDLLRDTYQTMMVVPELNLPHLREQQGFDAILMDSSPKMAAVLRARLTHLLAALDYSMPQLIELLERDAVEFQRFWSAEFAARGLAQIANRGPTHGASPVGVDLAAQQQQLARHCSGGRTRLELAGLNVALVLIPQGSGRGFWVTDTPIPNRVAAQWRARFGSGCEPRQGPQGLLLWSAAMLQQLRAELALEDLHLPDFEQAACLQRVCSSNRQIAHRLGLQAYAANFWVAAENGVIHAAVGASELPVFLTAQLRGVGHG